MIIYLIFCSTVFAISPKTITLNQTVTPSIVTSSSIKTATLNKTIKLNSDIYIYVDGMVCSFCAQGITKSLKKHKSIKKVAVNMTSNLIEVDLKLFRTISDKEITNIIDDSGYSVNSIKRR